MLKPVRTVAPAVDLVTLAEAKKHCRVDDSDNDEFITGLIAAATSWLDGYAGVLGRALINQTWRIDLCRWPSCGIRLPLAPVSAITAISYRDTDNVSQALGSANYSLLEDALSPYVGWAHDAELPSLYSRDDAVSVYFVAGYGATADTVPAAIRVAANMLIAHFHENRETSIVGTTAQTLPFGVDALIAPFRRVGL